MKSLPSFVIALIVAAVIVLCILSMANTVDKGLECMKAETDAMVIETVILDCTVTPNCFITSDTLTKKLELDIEKRTACPNETK